MIQIKLSPLLTLVAQLLNLQTQFNRDVVVISVLFLGQ